MPVVSRYTGWIVQLVYTSFAWRTHASRCGRIAHFKITVLFEDSTIYQHDSTSSEFCKGTSRNLDREFIAAGVSGTATVEQYYPIGVTTGVERSTVDEKRLL